MSSSGVRASGWASDGSWVSVRSGESWTGPGRRERTQTSGFGADWYSGQRDGHGGKWWYGGQPRRVFSEDGAWLPPRDHLQ
jgi:hypothetical protein